jgi:uncharacterized membrane protein required for colicin V production
MTILDFIVLLIILYSSVKGMMRGFVLSVFDITSFFIAAFFAAKFYPFLSNILVQTKLYEWIQKGISESILKTDILAIQTVNPNLNESTAKTVMDSLSLPSIIQLNLARYRNADFTGFIDTHNMVEYLSIGISKLIINILSIIILFCITKLILHIIATIIDQFARLPILDQVNRVAGCAFGFISGAFIVYVICALFTLLAPIQAFNPFLDYINNSMIAKVFYNHNMLLRLIL